MADTGSGKATDERALDLLARLVAAAEMMVDAEAGFEPWDVLNNAAAAGEAILDGARLETARAEIAGES